MYKSLYFKIILILILFIVIVMSVVGTVLLSGIGDYFTEEFVAQMDACFDEDSELSEELAGVLADGAGAEVIATYLEAYAGSLGLDDYRKYTVLSPDGTVLETDGIYSVGETVNITQNILTVMNGESRIGSSQVVGAETLNYCVRLSDTDDTKGGYLIYIYDTKEETQNLNWRLFSIILQALLFGLIFAVILSFFLAKTITAPIQSLTRGAQQMAAGEFEQELTVHSHDEIGTLTDTFNYMKRVLKSTLDQVSGEQRKLETVFFYLKDSVIAYRDDGTVMHMNTTARDLFRSLGETKPTKVTFSGLCGLCGIDVPQIQTQDRADDGVSEKESVFRELHLKDRVYEMRCGSFRYTEEEREHGGVIAVIHDITGQYELDRSRREFVANVSHELRTPLTGIKGAAETVLRYPDMPPEMRESFLTMAVEESDRMTRIVGDLLVLSRLDNNRTKWEISTFSVADMLSHLCEVVRPEAEAHHHRVVLRTENGLPQITADKDRIAQVILNIMTNAIKYTPDNGKILVRAMYSDHVIGISVRDNGMGIPEGDLPHIFERFYRVEKSRTTGAGGTGLGLAIAKDLVEAHGGSVYIESEVGKGTEVTILLPERSALADLPETDGK